MLIQLTLPCFFLPGLDWPTLPQYASGTSCPALIAVNGRTLAYVEGSLMHGGARFVEVTI